MMYDELIEELRRHHCDAKEDDTQEICEECAYDVIIADKSVPSGIASVCVCGLMNRAADAIEELRKAVLQLEDESGIYDELPTFYIYPTKWIPVTERLPKINSDGYSDDLIVCMRRFDGESYYYEKFAGYLTSHNIWYTYQHDSCSQVGIEQHIKHRRETADVIVAWMPMPSLPEPPKDGE